MSTGKPTTGVEVEVLVFVGGPGVHVSVGVLVGPEGVGVYVGVLVAPHGFGGEELLRGFIVLLTVKSERLLSVSTQPAPFLTAAVVLLRTPVGPVPS
jgi:hypothetical protein